MLLQSQPVLSRPITNASAFAMCPAMLVQQRPMAGGFYQYAFEQARRLVNQHNFRQLSVVSVN